MRLFRFLRIAFALYKGGGAWAEDSEWEDSDAISLRHFLSGVSGQRLRARLRNASIRMNAMAVLSPDPAGDGRKAAGYMLAIEDFTAMAGPQQSQYEEEEGASSFLEQIAP